MKNSIMLGPTAPYLSAKWHGHTTANLNFEWYHNDSDAFLHYTISLDQGWRHK